jgi:hypothetical protein
MVRVPHARGPDPGSGLETGGAAATLSLANLGRRYLGPRVRGSLAIALCAVGEIAMQKALLISIVVLMSLSGASATAMPFGLLPPAPPDVMSVSMGCGPGWTQDPYTHRHPTGGVYYGYHRYYHPHYHGSYYTSDLPMRELQWLWNDP